MSGEIIWEKARCSAAGLLCYCVIRQQGEQAFGLAVFSRREYAVLPCAMQSREQAISLMHKLAKAGLRPYQLPEIAEDWVVTGRI